MRWSTNYVEIDGSWSRSSLDRKIETTHHIEEGQSLDAAAVEFGGHFGALIRILNQHQDGIVSHLNVVWILSRIKKDQIDAFDMQPPRREIPSIDPSPARTRPI